jgi:hypothetical protein
VLLAAALLLGEPLDPPSSAAAAGKRVYVGEPVNGCGAEYCRGPSRLLYKPRTLTLVTEGDGYFIVKVTGLRWKRWGTRRAVGTGRTRVGDPDNGYQRGRVKVVLSDRGPAGCSDEAGRYTAYARADLHATSLGFARPVRFQTLGC